MSVKRGKAEVIAIKELLERDEDFVRPAVQSYVQAALEAEMTEALAAGKGERTDGRLGYRSGYYRRALITRVGTLELRVQQDRAGPSARPGSKIPISNISAARSFPGTSSSSTARP